MNIKNILSTAALTIVLSTSSFAGESGYICSIPDAPVTTQINATISTMAHYSLGANAEDLTSTQLYNYDLSNLPATSTAKFLGRDPYITEVTFVPNPDVVPMDVYDNIQLAIDTYMHGMGNYAHRNGRAFVCSMNETDDGRIVLRTATGRDHNGINIPAATTLFYNK